MSTKVATPVEPPVIYPGTRIESIEDGPDGPSIHYNIRYHAGDYTFPCEDKAASIRFDDCFMHIELTDGRILSVPLDWNPELKHATAAERERYEIDESGEMISWDPQRTEINEVFLLRHYLMAEQPRYLHRDQPFPPPAEIRKRYGLSQRQFAKFLGVSTRAVQEWEQGRRTPRGPSATLLRLAAQQPEVFTRLVVGD